MGQYNKTLLITNYWYPFNTPGSLRWIQLGRYLDFDVLTCKQPRKGFIDETLPVPRDRMVFQHFSNLPAVLFGLSITLLAIFRRYDLYIITIPPFTLSICAWILQTMGRKVILDIRDNQANKNNHWRAVTWLCQRFQSMIRHRTASFQFLDPGAVRVLSGYSPELERKVKDPMDWEWHEFYSQCRLSYKGYLFWTSHGVIQNYRKRMKNGYAASSFVDLLYLGFLCLPIENLHEECRNQPIWSWKRSAYEMKKNMEAANGWTTITTGIADFFKIGQIIKTGKYLAKVMDVVGDQMAIRPLKWYEIIFAYTKRMVGNG